MTKHKIGEIVKGNELQVGLYYRYVSGNTGYTVEEYNNHFKTSVLKAIDNITCIFCTIPKDENHKWCIEIEPVIGRMVKLKRVPKPRIITNPYLND